MKSLTSELTEIKKENAIKRIQMIDDVLKKGEETGISEGAKKFLNKELEYYKGESK